MKLTLKSVLLIMGLCLSYSLNAMNNPESEGPYNLENACTQEDFIRWLEQENTNLWKELEKVYGITESGCQKFKEEEQYKAEYEDLVEEMVQNDRVALELSDSLMAVIEAVLRDMGVQKDALRVVPFTKRSPAGSTDSVLFINMQCLPNAMPDKIKKYLIALAVWMAKNNDHSTDFVLTKIRQLNDIQDTPELQKVMENYEILKTIRADINVMLLGNEYREAQNRYVQILNHQLGQNKENVARLIVGHLMTKALDKKV